MRNLAGCVLLLALLSAQAYACSYEGWSHKGLPLFKACPESIARYIDRENNCRHFAGEIGGDGADADRRANDQLQKHGCDTIVCDRQKFLNQYKSNAETYNAIAAALTSVERNNGGEGGEWRAELKESEKQCPKY